ncbi:beta-lactamase domain-containing protein [Neobacillus bataviensis LMG 21833]|uniref:Beta-lactamase domain-containing protein n=1 Tax=Neobacillus bataviensis LMG 21833 TaxID=1117379 RepID=K6DH03_9BACI|nr:NUDIX hydrolase [Neobacillus bataviensis]EKN67564.1 beta-lactamase domain-containing protein [Neobacillus bataviensis LMG 21833]
MTAIPRPASTVVLMDQSSRVYLTKRPETMKFFGGYYVFPGGAVDQADGIQDCNGFINGIRNDTFELSHYVAAARELFEEVGILVCKKEDGSPVQLNEEIELEYRRLLIKGDISFLQLLKKEGLQFQLDHLTYFGQIITPTRSRIRFDTRFFLAQLPTGQAPKPDAREISETKWITPVDALTAFQNGEILLGPPTIHALKTIINHQYGGHLQMPEFNENDYLVDIRE